MSVYKKKRLFVRGFVQYNGYILSHLIVTTILILQVMSLKFTVGNLSLVIYLINCMLGFELSSL